MTKESVSIKAVKDDPADSKYIECAVEGKADYIVTGDHHLLDLKYYHGIQIIESVAFLKVM